MARRNPYDRTLSMRAYRFSLQTKRKVQDTLESSVSSVGELLEPGIEGAEKLGSALEDWNNYRTDDDLEEQNTLDSLENEQQYER